MRVGGKGGGAASIHCSASRLVGGTAYGIRPPPLPMRRLTPSWRYGRPATDLCPPLLPSAAPRSLAQVLELHFAAAALHAVVVNVNVNLAPPELLYVLQVGRGRWRAMLHRKGGGGRGMGVWEDG